MKWNKRRIEELLPNLSSQIQSIRPGHSETEDIFIWQPLRSGVYTTRSGYCSAVVQKHPVSVMQSFNWIKDVWDEKYSPKMKVFIWSIIQKALPLGENLQNRGFQSATLCIKCKEKETAMHIFFTCPFAREVWSKVPLKQAVHIAAGATFQDMIIAFRSMVCLPPSGISRNILPWICWALWTARNTQIFEAKIQSAEEVSTRGLRLAQEWIVAQGNLEQKEQRIRSLSGAKGDTDYRRSSSGNNTGSTSICRTDAALDKTSKRAGLAWIISNGPNTEAMQGSLTEDRVSSPIVAEALALRSGLIAAVERDLTRIKLYSDNITLIRAIKFETQAKEIYGIIHDIQRISSAFIEISYHHLSRNLISDVDLLAKKSPKWLSCLNFLG
ncbi:hypothetical protein Bca101_067503 [Brassica carinata]